MTGVLILLPPSEGKTPARRGRPLDLETLAFPELTPMRADVIDDVRSVSEQPDAHEVLGVSPNLVEEVDRNRRLLTAPTAAAVDVYTGVLYQALDHASLDAPSKRRAGRQVVIMSALFGALRLTDRIPAYRVNLCSTLPTAGQLSREWRADLARALDAVARPRELVVDCRSSTYTGLWRPRGPLAERWVQIAVPGASHMAKFTRGLVTRELVSAEAPRTPTALAERLAGRFEVDLQPPAKPTQPWVLSVRDESRPAAGGS